MNESLKDSSTEVIWRSCLAVKRLRRIFEAFINRGVLEAVSRSELLKSIFEGFINISFLAVVPRRETFEEYL